MANLRNVDISREASFQIDSNRLENSSYLLENLRSLSKARVSRGNSAWLSKLSGLQSLSCVFVNDALKDNQFGMVSFNDHLTSLKGVFVNDALNQFGMVSFNDHLTSLEVENAARWKQRFRSTCQLPSTLRELTLSKSFLKSDDITEIGKSLPHLEVFKIYSCCVPSGYQWNVFDEDFTELKVLELRDLEISKWIISEDSFPSLEELWVEKCRSLEAIPLEFGNIMNLRVISVKDCSPSVDNSARQIEIMQQKCLNDEMRVIYQPESFNRMQSMSYSDLLEVDEITDGIGFSDMVLSKWLRLRYLSLDLMNTEIAVLPLSISKLQNLQILILKCKKVIRVPESMWHMVMLRHVDISPEASFEIDSKRLQNSSVLLENLRSLSKARVSCGDSKWLNKLFLLQRLSCVVVDDDVKVDADLKVNDDTNKDDDLHDNQIQMLNLNFCLTSLKVKNAAGWKQRFITICQLPRSLCELTLSSFFLKSNDIVVIGTSLPRLEVFKIYSCSVPSGYEWNVDDRHFPKLKVLKLRDLAISKWIVSEYCFFYLEQLWVEKCDDLDQIPLEFGDLPILRLITVKQCAPSVDYSAKEIEKMQYEQLNTDMRVCIHPKKILATSPSFQQKSTPTNNEKSDASEYYTLELPLPQFKYS